MAILDDVIGVFSPGWKAARLRSRAVIQAYEAVKTTRTHKARRENRTADQLSQYGAVSLREQARYLDNNHDLVIGVFDKLEERVVGKNGIIVEPHPVLRNGAIARDLAAEIRTRWSEWSVSPEVTGQFTRPMLERLMLRTWLRDGEVFVQMVSGRINSLTPSAGVHFWLEALEPDFIPMTSDESNRLNQGVFVDDWGRPEKYLVYKSRPVSGRQMETKEVDAERMLHLKFVRRLHQMRGTSLLSGVLIRLSALKDYEDYELTAARIAAALGMYIRKGDGQSYEPDGNGSKDKERELTIQPGIIYDDLKPGEEIGMVKSDRPNPNLETFRNGQLRAVAAGSRLSFSSTARNYNGTYSAQRQELVESTDGYLILQDWFIGAVTRPMYRAWLKQAVASGVIRLPRDLDRSSLYTAVYSGPVMPWIDPVKEAEAWKIQIRGGAATESDWVAMSALAEETGRRTADIDNNLNALGSTLKYLSDLWSRFWDAAMNIGREDSLDEQISALQEKVSRAKRLPWTASSSQVEYDQQRLNELQEKKRQKDLQDAKEQAERNYQEQQKRRNAENAALNRMNETEAARHQREIARINAMQYADQAVRDAAIQRENERYEKALASGKKKTRETRNDEATRLLLQYSQQQAQVEGQIAAARQSSGIATERMTEAHKQLLALQQRISDLDGKKLTADEKSVLARKDELIQALTLLDVKQQELQKQTALNELKKKTIQLTSQLAEEERAQRQQHDLDIATVGMGDQQRQRYQVQLSLRQKYQQQLEQLRRDSEQKGTYNTDDYRKAEQALTESLNRQLNENRRYWQQLEVVQGNWKNGVLRAFQDFTVDADNTAGTAEQVFSSAFSYMGNGLATFVTTGKLNFKSFTSSVLSDMAKILAQATMMKSIKGIGSVLGFDLSSLSLNANGGIYQSADLSRYSGTVVNRPTFFAFAKGAGVMGEAGPEAILPLRRGADGKLGVVADIGGSGMAMFAPQYNIEINNDGTNGQIGPAALKVVYDLGKKAAADFMQQQARDGGRLSGAYR
ncbi:phage portal protein [Escherichia coli]|nr:phage portal protein [Escherichia coli]